MASSTKQVKDHVDDIDKILDDINEVEPDNNESNIDITPVQALNEIDLKISNVSSISGESNSLSSGSSLDNTQIITAS